MWRKFISLTSLTYVSNSSYITNILIFNPHNHFQTKCFCCSNEPNCVHITIINEEYLSLVQSCQICSFGNKPVLSSGRGCDQPPHEAETCQQRLVCCLVFCLVCLWHDLQSDQTSAQQVQLCWDGLNVFKKVQCAGLVATNWTPLVSPSSTVCL